MVSARVARDHQALPALVDPGEVRLTAHLAAILLTLFPDALEALVVTLMICAQMSDGALDASFALFRSLLAVDVLEVDNGFSLLDQALLVPLIARASLPGLSAAVAEFALANAPGTASVRSSAVLKNFTHVMWLHPCFSSTMRRQPKHVCHSFLSATPMSACVAPSSGHQGVE